jgi:predicted dehydrogenase
MCIRFWPEYHWVKKAIDEGKFGKVLAARFRRVGEPPAWGHEHFFDGAKSGGAILDLHIHDADFVQYCFGRPKAVYAMGLTRFSGAIDHVMAQYQVECGASVSAEGSWIMNGGHGFNMAFTVNFEKATVDYDLARGRKAFRLFRDGKKPRTIKAEGPEDGYVGELTHILDSIAAAQAPSVVTAGDGASAVEIIEAEEKSIATGQVVTL